jgi:predicted dinucleotide-binding enzyme
MKTAIIGTGNIGSRIARNLAAGGQSVIVAHRNLDTAKTLASTLGGNVQAMTVDDALKAADIIVLAIYFDAIREFVSTHQPALAGKIVVDPSNPIAPDGQGGFKKIIPADQSAGTVIAALLPKDVKLVKAFGTMSAASLEAGANRSPERAVLFYATDYPDAGRAVAGLITASGFAPVSVGGIDQSIRIEAFGDLNEHGKIDGLVSETKAKSLV